MDADLAKRRSLIMGLSVLCLIACVFVSIITGAVAPIVQWVHDSATATLPINDPEYMYSRALEYDQDGNSTYASAAARRAIMIEPGYAPARKFLAAKDLKNHDFADAALQCKGLLGKNPNDSTALLGLASAYGGLGQSVKSEEIYRQVMQNTVNTEAARNAAARALGVPNPEIVPKAVASPSGRNP